MSETFRQLRTREDLLSLIEDGIEEGLTIDYKSSPSLSRQSKDRDELCKDVSALANSAGGQIVYSVVEDKENKGKPASIDGGVSDPKISVEWINQVLNSSVRPRLDTVSVQSIDLRPGTGFVITVGQSHTAHQAPDKKYYKRVGTESVPMDDYEIADVRRRGSAPILWVMMEAHKGRRPSPDDQFVSVSITAWMGNKSSAPAIYVALHLLFDDRLEITKRGPMKHSDVVTFAGKHVGVVYRNFAPPADFPLFKESHLDPIEMHIGIPVGLVRDSFFVGAHVATPGYERLFSGTIRLEEGRAVLEWENI